MIDLSNLTETETYELIQDAWPNLTEEHQIELAKRFIIELGGPENFNWDADV